MPKKKHTRTLYDMQARFMFEKLTNFIKCQGGDPPKKKIQGMFRTESYEWTVFKFFKDEDIWRFQYIQFVQHEGECVKHLNNKVLIG